MKDQLNLSINNLLEKLMSWFDTTILNLPNVILAIVVFILSYIFAKKFSQKVTHFLTTRISQGSIRSLIGSAVMILFTGLGIILALGILNLDQALNSIIAGAGVAGLAIGLAIQGTLSNTFAGINLALKNDINIGDFIETNGFAGTVVDINLRDTKVRTQDNNLVIIPNNSISNNPFKNFSLTEDLRVTLETGVAYESDLKKVEEVSRKAISDTFTYRTDEFEFYFLRFGPSSIDVQIRFWIKATERFALTRSKSKAIVLLKEAFDRESISIPYPIQTVIAQSAE